MTIEVPECTMEHRPPEGATLPRLRLVGEDGNAYSILGRWRRAALKIGWDRGIVSAVVNHAMISDYQHLLRTIDDYCIEVGEERPEDDTD